MKKNICMTTSIFPIDPSKTKNMEGQILKEWHGPTMIREQAPRVSPISTATFL
jgi:hypothetical protein